MLNKKEVSRGGVGGCPLYMLQRKKHAYAILECKVSLYWDHNQSLNIALPPVSLSLSVYVLYVYGMCAHGQWYTHLYLPASLLLHEVRVYNFLLD